MPVVRTDCLSCANYYITWDKRFPNGCRAMHFKSKRMPCLEVLDASGYPCQSHAPRDKSPLSGAATRDER